MNIWLVTIGEPLPTETDRRPHRSGMMSVYLQKSGHNVIWWSSTFDHSQKTHRFDHDKTIVLADGRKLNLLHGLGYKSNVSLSRIIDHRQIANRFSDWSREEIIPDIILCSYPPIELSHSVIDYGQEYGVPVILDVRDLWPDIFTKALPSFLKIPAEYLVSKLYEQSVRDIFSKTTSIVGISKDYLTWGLNKGNRKLNVRDKIIPLAYPAKKERRFNKNVLEYIKSFGIDDSRIIFLFIGTFGKTYDLTVPIESAKILGSQLKQPPLFVFCGSGEQENKWREKAGTDKNIIFTGWLEKNEIAYILSIADVGLASYAKGAPQSLPNKIIEYMSEGLPILSSLGNETELLLKSTGAGYTYRASDTQQFIDYAKIMLDENNRKEMSKKSKSCYLKSFQADNIYESYVQHLESICKNYYI